MKESAILWCVILAILCLMLFNSDEVDSYQVIIGDDFSMPLYYFLLMLIIILIVVWFVTMRMPELFETDWPESNDDDWEDVDDEAYGGDKLERILKRKMEDNKELLVRLSQSDEIDDDPMRYGSQYLFQDIATPCPICDEPIDHDDDEPTRFCPHCGLQIRDGDT